MKKTLLFSILFVAIVGLNSCKKESLEGDNLDFAGYWYSEYNTLYIGTDGYGSFERLKGSFSSYIDGKVKVNDKFVIFSAGIVTKKLSIDERPSFNLLTGQGEMVLKGETYYSY